MFLAYPTLNQLWSIRAFFFCTVIYIFSNKWCWVLGNFKQHCLEAQLVQAKKPPTNFYRYVFMEKRGTSLKLSLCGELKKWKKKGMRSWNFPLQSEHSLGLKLSQSLYPARHLAVHVALTSDSYCWWLVKSPGETCHRWGSPCRAHISCNFESSPLLRYICVQYYCILTPS